MAVTYADVLAKNVRAARARKGLDQEPLAARMRALGYSAWRRQTVANVEKGSRRLAAEEVLALALALESSLVGLLEPVRDDRQVELPSGTKLEVLAIHELIWGGAGAVVSWEGDVPHIPGDGPPSRDLEPYLPPPPIRR